LAPQICEAALCHKTEIGAQKGGRYGQVVVDLDSTAISYF